jgi:hypothetical protein
MSLVHAIREAVQIIVEQARIHVQRHRGRVVPEHPLNRDPLVPQSGKLALTAM